MRIILMNSAMMPETGTYECKYVDMDSWIKAFHKLYSKTKTFVSTIGYPQTATHLSDILKIDVPENRINTDLKSGDIMFVCRLAQRQVDPSTKGDIHSSPFVYAIITFK